MKKLTLLLLDANVVITLHELGLWETILDSCDIHLAGTIIEHEVLFFRNQQGDDQSIDLSSDIAAGRFTRFDVSLSDVNAFKCRFRPDYFDSLDPGEAEALTYVINSKEELSICSGDKIVYRVLGALYLKERGVSLEEVLQRIGHTRAVEHEYSKNYREHWSSVGFREGLQGMA